MEQQFYQNCPELFYGKFLENHLYLKHYFTKLAVLSVYPMESKFGFKHGNFRENRQF